MTARKLLTRLFKSLFILIAVLVLFVSMLDFVNLSFTLDSGRRFLVEQIKSYTGRDVRIDGEVKLTVSLIPQLLVHRIHISNPDGFSDEDFVTVNQVEIDLAMIPLLSGQLHFSDISADQAEINLVKKKDGSHNWSFENASRSSEQGQEKPTASDDRHNGVSQFSIEELQLTNVAIRYDDQSRGQVIETQLDQLMIELGDMTKPIAEINGHIQGFPYELTFVSDPLSAHSSGKPWFIHGTGYIAGKQTRLEANVQLVKNEIRAEAGINVRKVNLGLLLDRLGIISGRDAATDSVNVKVKVQGSDPVELYEQAEISLQLGKGYWRIQSTDAAQEKDFFFDKASSYTSWHKPVVLHLDGNYSGEAVKLDLKTNRLLEFFDEVQKLDIDLVSSIATTDITLKGTLDLPIVTKQFNLDLSVKGKNLERLNPIINAEFPPFKDFSLTGNLIANSKGFILKSAKASIGDTQLQASIVIDTSLEKPLWTINLSSRQIQLKDFAFENWSTTQTDTGTAEPREKKNGGRPWNEPLQRLEAIVRDPRMHLNLNLKVDKLLSGEDQLGKARFQLQLRDNAFSLQNADVEIPGGRIKTSISLSIDGTKASGQLLLDIDKLDYGITTRLFKPDSQVNGTISVRTDLQLGGNHFTHLLDDANGQLDFVLWPKNTRPAKALNLWATNLYLILLPELNKKESKVNCVVGLMDLVDGNMDEQLFAIDTTKLWINGNVDVDFKKEYLQLSLFPRSKTARLFSLQSPIRAQGSFSDISLLMNPLDLAGTYISFVTSPLTVPTRWIFGKKIPDDGSAECELLFDREYVKKLKAEVEKKEKQELEEIMESD